VPPRPQPLPPLTTQVFSKWLIPVLTEWVGIVLLFGAGYSLDHGLVWACVIVLLGSRQHALGVLGHDGAHRAAAKNRHLNDLATQVLCMWPLAVGLGSFRRFHFQHHRHFGTDLDPELRFKNQWSETQWNLPATKVRIIGYFLLDLIGFGAPEVLKALRLLGRVGWWDWAGPVLWWAIAGTFLYLTGLWFVAVVWAAALGTSFWGFFRLRTWTEHVGTAATHRVRANWWQRVFITPHGSWSHYEHHDHPAVPFWRREALREDGARTITIGELFTSFGRKEDQP
jgi:fatty acid desaturase